MDLNTEALLDSATCLSWTSQWPYMNKIINIIIIMQMYVSRHPVQPRHKYALLELSWQGMSPSQTLKSKFKRSSLICRSTSKKQKAAKSRVLFCFFYFRAPYYCMVSVFIQYLEFK